MTMMATASGAVTPKRILIATIGSLGDLHPVLALALELKRRGHRVTIASPAYHQQKVEEIGLQFHALRPNWEAHEITEVVRRCADMRSGFEVLLRDIVLPYLRDTYDDLLTAAAAADLMIAGEMVFPAPLVAEKLGLRWASAILSPCSFLSSHDAAVLANAPGLELLGKVHWRVYRAVMELCKSASRHWWEPVRQLRREEGLRVACDPVFKDKFSMDLVLALFSPVLGRPQPDWPAQTVQPGFVFFEQKTTMDSMPEDLAKFLAQEDAPIVFTQGSTAVHNPGDFFAVSAECARRLGRRAVLVGADAAMRGDGILAVPYAPYAMVFPHAAVNVHQGGSGTTGQALRAGRPMLIVPYGWDQPDNAARVERLGTGLHLPRKKYSVERGVAAMARLLQERSFAARAAATAEAMQKEDGLTGACDAIEGLLR